MACDVRILINWRMVFKVIFKPFSKYSWRFTYIFLITLYLVPPIPYITPVFCVIASLSLGGHQEVLDGIASFQIYLYAMFIANIHKLSLIP